MVYSESGNIVIIFESGKFELDNSDLNSKKMSDLEDQIKQEIDSLQIITSEIKDANLGINDKCTKLKKRSKCLRRLQVLFGIIPVAGIISSIIMRFKNVSANISLASIYGGIGAGLIGLVVTSSKIYGKNNELIKAYEENITISLNILEKLDKMNLKGEDKKKVKEALEKVKKTADEINDLKEAFKNDEKFADEISDKYNLDKRINNLKMEEVNGIGVVLSSSSDDEYTYINVVFRGCGLYTNCNLGLTKSQLDNNPPKIKLLDYKRLSDSWGNNIDFWYPGYKDYYLILKCEKTDYKFKKGQIFVDFC